MTVALASSERELCTKESFTVCPLRAVLRAHTSVAAQIANGSADAGMGIYSAAKLYDLDFIPICVEEYDLIITEYAWNTPMVQQLITILKSDAFRQKILEMGGYTLDCPGELRQYE